MSTKRNIIVGQSGGPTAVINSSVAGVYTAAKELGFNKIYGMLHGIQGLLDPNSMRRFSGFWTSLRSMCSAISAETTPWIPSSSFPIMRR